MTENAVDPLQIGFYVTLDDRQDSYWTGRENHNVNTGRICYKNCPIHHHAMYPGGLKLT